MILSDAFKYRGAGVCCLRRKFNSYMSIILYTASYEIKYTADGLY